MRAIEEIELGASVDENIDSLRADKKFSKGHIIGCFYGTLVYSDISQEDETGEIYGKGLLGTSVQRFRRTSMSFQIPETTDLSSKDFLQTGLEGQSNQLTAVFIVPASFSVFSCMRLVTMAKSRKTSSKETSSADAVHANAFIERKRFPIKRKHHLKGDRCFHGYRKGGSNCRTGDNC